MSLFYSYEKLTQISSVTTLVKQGPGHQNGFNSIHFVLSKLFLMDWSKTFVGTVTIVYRIVKLQPHDKVNVLNFLN